MLLDGRPAAAWDASCRAPQQCATVRVPAGGAANLTLWLRSLRGVAAVSVGALLLLSAYLLVSRSRSLEYLCTIAVTQTHNEQENNGFKPPIS